MAKAKKKAAKKATKRCKPVKAKRAKTKAGKLKANCHKRKGRYVCCGPTKKRKAAKKR